jgi:hypothetical protein
MQSVRPVIAVDPRRFGRGIQRDLPASPVAGGLSDDFKLFATTFLAGFLFVSILLA